MFDKINERMVFGSPLLSHYSKRQIFVQKFDFNKILDIFSREIKVVNSLKYANSPTFSRIFS